MRVVSGTAKGRPLKAVPGMGTRPTTDKVKEAIFSMIGPYFNGGNVLDLFAGTGGLGIEALSRGMTHGIFIDMDKKSIDTVRENLQTAGLHAQAEVYRNEAFRAIRALAKRGLQFSLVFLDPPYRLHFIEDILLQLQEAELLARNAMVVVEHDGATAYGRQVGCAETVKQAVYGDTAITIYRLREDMQG